MSVWYSVKAARSGVVAVNKRGEVAVKKKAGELRGSQIIRYLMEMV